MSTAAKDTIPPLALLSRDDFPGELFRSFKYELGQINIHVCVADAALLEFEARARESREFLKDSVRRHGHRNLNVAALNVELALDLSYASHIALLLSRMDQLCQRVRRHPVINRELSGSAEGDFLRKALWLILVSHGDTKLPKPIDTRTTEQLLGKVEVQKFDAFRNLRNDQLHAGEGKVDELSLTAALQHPRFAEVLECSKTLQTLARRLCRALAGSPEALAPVLDRRFGLLKASRRRNAAMSALVQDYLLDKDEVPAVLSELAW